MKRHDALPVRHRRDRVVLAACSADQEPALFEVYVANFERADFAGAHPRESGERDRESDPSRRARAVTPESPAMDVGVGWNSNAPSPSSFRLAYCNA